MKITFGNLSITGPYTELKSLFTMLSIDDLEKFTKVEGALRESKLDIADLQSKISLLTKVVERLDNDVINKILDAME